MKWETGYYVNGHLGQYAMGEMLKVADEFCASMGEITDWHNQARLVAPVRCSRCEAELTEDGYSITCAWAGHTLSDYMPWDGGHFEWLEEIVDKAESKMNDLSPEGFAWGWEDGEFYLTCRDDDDDDNDDDDDDDEHEHNYGPWEHSRLAGTLIRRCQVVGCQFISLDGDNDDDDNEREES